MATIVVTQCMEEFKFSAQKRMYKINVKKNLLQLNEKSG